MEYIPPDVHNWTRRKGIVECGCCHMDIRNKFISEKAGVTVQRGHGIPWGTAGAVVAMLFLGLYLFARYDSKYTMVLAAACAVVLAMVAIVRAKFDTESGHQQVSFVVALVATGLIYMLVFAPGTVPDEIYHFNSSYKYSDIILGQEVSDDSISMRGDDVHFEENVLLDFESQPHLDRSLYRNTVLEARLFASDSSYEQFPVDSAYPVTSDLPQLKIPSAIGIVLAKLLNLGSVPLFYLGRLFNFIFFVVLVVLSIRITPIGRNVFKVVALLPMSLHVATSYSYDAGTIGISFLFCALAFKAIYFEDKLTKKILVILAISALLLSPCKVVYTLLLVLLIFIPADRFSSRRICIIYKGGIIGAGLILIGLLRLPTLLGTIGGVSVSTSQGDQFIPETYSVMGLLANPVEFVLLIARTIDALGDFYLLSMIGQQPGWFQGELFAPVYSVLPLFFILGIAMIKMPGDNRVLPRRQRIVLVIVFLLIGLALVGSAIGWTPKGGQIIEGVQGRYFLPALPILCLALRGHNLQSKKSLMPVLETAEAFFSLFIVLRVFAIALTL